MFILCIMHHKIIIIIAREIFMKIKFYTFRAMEGLYHQTNGLLEQTQGYFIRLEQGGCEDGERLQAEIQTRLDTMWANAERLDLLAAKEPAQRRQVARQKIDQLKYDIQHLHSALQVGRQGKLRQSDILYVDYIFSPWPVEQP